MRLLRGGRKTTNWVSFTPRLLSLWSRTDTKIQVRFFWDHFDIQVLLITFWHSSSFDNIFILTFDLKGIQWKMKGNLKISTKVGKSLGKTRWTVSLLYTLSLERNICQVEMFWKGEEGEMGRRQALSLQRGTSRQIATSSICLSSTYQPPPTPTPKMVKLVTQFFVVKMPTRAHSLSIPL